MAMNPNSEWAALFVDELARVGVREACIAPGSRSTPLTLAFARQSAIRVYRHLDERSAAFFALGLALETGRPAALVCTSGTAAANFHPAVIEAYYAHVPLLVLTADRPPELRDSGANQTIDQVKMFGDHVLWAVDAPVPQADAPDVVLSHLRTLAARAVATADGLVRGPVHLNFPFRKPLEPASPADMPAAGSAAAPPFTAFSRGIVQPTAAQVDAAAELIRGASSGLIVCGPSCAGGDFPAAVVELAERAGFPVLADALSGVRHGPQAGSEMVLGGYGLWLPHLAAPAPEVILRFGAVPTSAALNAYLERHPEAQVIHVREDGRWADDLHLTRHYTQADPTAFCTALSARLAADGQAPLDAWPRPWIAAEAAAWAAVDLALADGQLFDGAVVARALAALPDGAAVFAGNSLPVRHVDTYDRPSTKRLRVFANRGANGIDGNVSAALGIAAAAGRPTLAILGDITFYHDMNGLLAGHQHGLDNATFLVLNNNGGGIFRRLPIAAHEPAFTELFLTPHDLTFGPAAVLYSLDYTQVTDDEALAEALAGLGRPGPARLIEVMTDNAADYERQRRVTAAVAAALTTQFQTEVTQ